MHILYIKYLMRHVDKDEQETLKGVFLRSVVRLIY